MGKLYSLGISVLVLTIFQSAWLQLDISPCSYQSSLVIVLILLCLAAPFLQPQAVKNYCKIEDVSAFCHHVATLFQAFDHL